MCGIAGIFNGTGPSSISLEVLTKMSNTMSHRGPDDEGTYIDNHVALGHKRLTIVDLTANARQPLVNEDQTLVLVFNGEIYNYESLKNTLKKDHCFRSKSDAEVILHLYEEFGFDCLHQLDGMFAFALYDKTNRRLFLARDRTGEKPLYYLTFRGAFYFASEIKAFHQIPGFQPEISSKGFLSFFLHTQVPAPLCIYRDIRKIVPSHYVVIDENNTLTQRPYWRLNCTTKTDRSLREALRDFDDVLEGAIRKSTVSDVPIGMSLSGGIDSSIVLAMMKRFYPEPIKTFTLGAINNGVRDLEFERAQRIATLFDSEHHTCDFENMRFSDFEGAICHFDEPVGIYDTVHTYYFHRFVSQHVKVLITGNGADEIFGGYRSYSAYNRKARLLDLLLGPLNRKRCWIDSILEQRFNRRNERNAQLLFSSDMAIRAYDFHVREYFRDYYELVDYDRVLDARLFNDLMITLNHTPSLGDTTGMAHSLEIRSPFLDREVMEFSATLPTSYKLKFFGDHLTNKFILKTLAKEYLPQDLIFAMKYPCGTFIDYFNMMKTSWRPDVEEVLFQYGCKLDAFFSQPKVHELWRNFVNNKLSTSVTAENGCYFLLKVIIFMVWHRRVFSPLS